MNPSKTQALAKAPPIAIAKGGLQIRSMEDALAFAQKFIDAGLAGGTQDRKPTPAEVVMKLQAGAELGIAPLRSQHAFNVINGRLGIGGEAALAKIRSTHVCDPPGHLRVGNRGEGDERVGFFEFKRTDTGDEDTITFSVAEAKRAGLWGKRTWGPYPDDMLVWRAVARGSKRYFSDILMGFEIAEVVRDYPPEAQRTVVETRALPEPDQPDPLLADVLPAQDDPTDTTEPCDCVCECSAPVNPEAAAKTVEKRGVVRCAECWPWSGRYDVELHADYESLNMEPDLTVDEAAKIAAEKRA